MIILYYIVNNFLKYNIIFSFFIVFIGIIIGFITTKIIEQKLIINFKDANKEIKMVIWPNLNETIQTTIFIIITVFIFFFFICLLDIMINFIFSSIKLFCII